MNKQQLAAKIWESANKMRSKIEANEYKDYILGFIFYKFLSYKEEKYLKELGFTDADLPSVTEEQLEIVTDVQNKIGYFIAYENMFSIVTRNGDTLEDDWPYFDDNDPVGTYDPLYVDAVVSNEAVICGLTPEKACNFKEFAA